MKNFEKSPKEYLKILLFSADSSPAQDCSPLDQLISEHLRSLPLDVVIEVQTLPPGNKTKNVYRAKFPLIQRKFSSPDAHAAAVLAMAYTFSQAGRVCHALDSNASDSVVYSWGPDSNKTLLEFEDEIFKRIVDFVREWTTDTDKFLQEQKSDIRSFLRGTGCGSGRLDAHIVVDQFRLYAKQGNNYINGTEVFAYLTAPLP